MIIILRYDTLLITLDVRQGFAADDNNTIIIIIVGELRGVLCAKYVPSF